MTEQLKCTKMIAVCDGTDNQGRRWIHHERCDRPAHEIVVRGLLTSAKAILCEQHRQAAERENFVSKKGFDLRHSPVKPKQDYPLLPFRQTK